jgi:transcription initiation factor TFIIIB Brf1 subunit/transcription initiation factor TFIIB
MSFDFEIFDEFDSSTESESDFENGVIFCEHLNTIVESGSILCCNCGLEIKKVISYEKDWRYYGGEDSRHTSDPNRCYIRKLEDKSIFRDVEMLGFSDKIMNIANDIYTKVTNGRIYRGNSRKAIVFSSVFHATKIGGKPYSCESLRDIFKLDRKIILKGLKHMHINVPKDSQIRTKYITPIELIEEYISKFNVSEEEKTEAIALYNNVKNKSSIINRSRPQSVASSIIYFFLSTKRGTNNFNIKDFVKKVKLSELTINKICREIAAVI